MARKEAVNTFTDGLNTDLNPLNTPNTILTDCLNGTLITYDGNEFTLQNDKGNYPLKNCKLPENYIPVGVKEYGDIIYIVSYNPITNKTQVGSYPSPQTIYNDTTETERSYTQVSNADVTDKHIESIWRTATRADISEDETLQVFYGGNKPELYKLNPGDQYKLTQTVVDGIGGLNLSPYEKIEFYVVDDNKKTHKIDDNEIKRYFPNETSDFNFVKWNVPGYLAVKTRVADIDDFVVNTRKIKVLKYENINNASNALEKLILNFQAVVSDDLIKNNIIEINQNEPCDLHVKIHYSGWSTEVNLNLKPEGIVKNSNGNWVYYWNWNALESSSAIYDVVATANSSIEFTITPEITWNNRTVTFKEFEKTITFDLSVKGDVNEFTIGDGTWKWTVDNNLTLRFDTGGIQENAVFDQDLFLHCTITRHTGINNGTHVYSNPITDNNNVVLNNISLEDLGVEWNVQGFTEMVLPFVSFPNSISSYESDKNRLYAEDYYKVEFRFYDEDNRELRNPICKNILATKLLNGNKADRYDQLTFEDWFPKYSNFVENKYVILNGDVDYSDPSKIINEIKPEDLAYYNIWMRGTPALKKYSTFSTYAGTGDEGGINDNLLKKGFDITATATFPLNVTYNNEVQLPIGPLWLGLIATTYYNDIPRLESFNMYTGRDDKNQPYRPSNLEGTCRKSAHYNLSRLVEDVTLFNYSSPNVQIPKLSDLSYYTLTADGRYDTALNKETAGFSPDIYIKYNSNEYVFEKDDVTLYNNAIEWILSSFGDYDALFITVDMPVQVIGDQDSQPSGNKNKLYISQFDYSSSSSPTMGRVYATATGTESVKTYWAVFKIPISGSSYNYSKPTRGKDIREKLWFVYINTDDKYTAYDRFKSICDNIQHFNGDDATYWGSFIKATAPIITSDSLVNINVEGKIKFSEWIFNNLDMFTSSRSNLNDNGCNLFTVPMSSSETYTSLMDINLQKKSVEIKYTDTNGYLEQLLNQYNIDINNQNDLIEDQYDEYMTDDIVKNLDLLGVNTFRSNEGQYEQFVNILNKSINCDSGFGLRVWDQYSPEFGTYGIYYQNLRLGVADEDLTI